MKFESPNFSIIKNDNQLKTVEFCARLCYKSMDKLTEDSYIKFCKARFAEKHYAIFEHANFLFKMNVDKQNNLLNMLHEFKNLYGVTYDFRFAHEEPTIDPETNELHMKLCEECVFVLNLRHIFELADAGDFRFYNALPEEYHIFYSEEDLKKHDKRFDSMWSFDFVDEKINDDKFNFVTVAFDCQRSVWDELARHRKNGLCCESSRYCQYSKGKFGGEITYSKPSWVEDEHDATYQELQSICKNAEDGYMKLTEMGLKAQDARFVLPLGYRVNCVVTASIEQWKHIFELRTSKAAHPDIAAIMSELKSEFERLNIS